MRDELWLQKSLYDMFYMSNHNKSTPIRVHYDEETIKKGLMQSSFKCTPKASKFSLRKTGLNPSLAFRGMFLILFKIPRFKVSKFFISDTISP